MSEIKKTWRRTETRVLEPYNTSRHALDGCGFAPTADREIINERESYQIDTDVVSALKLGVPQTRSRHLLVASKFAKPSVSGGLNAFERPTRNIRWAIGDLVSRRPSNAFDRPAELSSDNKERISFLFDKDLFELPDEQRPDCHKDGHTYPSVYGRLKWDEPSGTITTGFMSPGRGRFTHPVRPRSLTPHEGARLQGFPDWFDFRTASGEDLTNKAYTKLIGDAVPPAIGFIGGIAALSTAEVDG